MILVFDVGGTGVKYGTADEQGNFLAQGRFDTPVSGLEEFLEKVEDVYRQAGDVSVIEGLAFSFPGEVHSREGVIRGISAVPYIHEVELKSTVERRGTEVRECGVCHLRNRNRRSGDRTRKAVPGSDHEPGGVWQFSHGRV